MGAHMLRLLVLLGIGVHGRSLWDRLGDIAAQYHGEAGNGKHSFVGDVANVVHEYEVEIQNEVQIDDTDREAAGAIIGSSSSPVGSIGGDVSLESAPALNRSNTIDIGILANMSTTVSAIQSELLQARAQQGNQTTITLHRMHALTKQLLTRIDHTLASVSHPRHTATRRKRPRVRHAK